MAWDGSERRSGDERRRNLERRNGLAVLMAGCSECGCIAPPPADMHAAGWEIEADDFGLVRITCPACATPAAPSTAGELPDYIVG
jgi:hypothetical protein